MPGWEIIGKEEKKNLIDIFKNSNGVLFAHGFNDRRNNIFRVRAFEKQVAKFLKVKYCVATTSGTMAQYVAMKALGIKRNDEVITQAFTFVATAESIIECGAKVRFLDINNSYNLDPNLIEKNITKKTRLIVPVSMLGNPCEMNRILKIAKKNKIKILEDACESFGAKYKKKYLGTMGDVGVFSLDFQKIISTGEGGLIVTNNKKIYKFCKEFIDHGHESNKIFPRGRDTRTIHGLNLRMNELQAAVGIAQLKKLKYIIKKNQENKSLLKNNIINYNNVISYRKIIDSKGELADTLIFQFQSKNQALTFVKEFNKHGYSTKNLPDAIDWHFSGTWSHMKNSITNFKKGYRYTKYLLESSVSIPIYVKTSKKEILKQAKIINLILKKI